MTESCGSGQDDITGGHNVIGGQDGSDIIEGGDDADVTWGDNGRIYRDWTANDADRWVTYPAPFADVIREVERYDDIELSFLKIMSTRLPGVTRFTVTVETTIFTASVEMIRSMAEQGYELIGQLGNDDPWRCRSGHDFGDNGYITRDYLDEATARINNNGSWHRDVTYKPTPRSLR